MLHFAVVLSPCLLPFLCAPFCLFHLLPLISPYFSRIVLSFLQVDRTINQSKMNGQFRIFLVFAMLLAAACVACYVVGLTTSHWNQDESQIVAYHAGLYEECLYDPKTEHTKNSTELCINLDDFLDLVKKDPANRQQ